MDIVQGTEADLSDEVVGAPASSGPHPFVPAGAPLVSEVNEAGLPDGMIEAALDLALELTRSPVAFAALVAEHGDLHLIFRRSADETGDLPAEVANRLARDVVANGAAATVDRSTLETSPPTEPLLPSFLGVQLQSGDEVLGMIGVANGPTYSPGQAAALGFFADQLAANLWMARMRAAAGSVADGNVSVRAAAGRQRPAAGESSHPTDMLERAQSLAVEAMRAVSSNVRSSEDLAAFYRLLTASVAGLVGAQKVLFWQLNPDRTLNAIPGAFGIDDDFIARFRPVRCDPDGTDLTSQSVFKDLIFRAALGDVNQSHEDRGVLDALRVSNALSVPWRSGDERLGIVAAYDSKAPGGFTPEDAWVLQIVGMAAGLVWQLKQAESVLAKTVERLQRVDFARHLLLKNAAAAADRATKRFASELHDDALQKLTAAELRLARAAQSGHTDGHKQAVADAQALLGEVEEALRKLLFDVRPPVLETPGGLEETIRDRLALMRAHTGVAIDIEFELAEDPAYEIKSMLYRQISEALTNIEKHAEPSRVRVTVKSENDGVYGAITDDGRGFIVEERNHLPGHLGLLALNERALLAGGWCKIYSEPGAGTIVEFWVPLPK